MEPLTQRQNDAVIREDSREHPIRTEEGHERVVSVAWGNNTFWRISVFIAFLASLFSIYDNSQRVQRLEYQVCLSLYQSRSDIQEGRVAYYRQNPEEAPRALARIETETKRFHCPAEPANPPTD